MHAALWLAIVVANLAAMRRLGGARGLALGVAGTVAGATLGAALRLAEVAHPGEALAEFAWAAAVRAAGACARGLGLALGLPMVGEF